MLPLNIFWEQHNSQYICNKRLQGDCLTRIACKAVYKSLLNEALFQATSTSNYQTPSLNIFTAMNPTECKKINVEKIKDKKL